MSSKKSAPNFSGLRKFVFEKIIRAGKSFYNKLIFIYLFYLNANQQCLPSNQRLVAFLLTLQSRPLVQVRLGKAGTSIVAHLDSSS